MGHKYIRELRNGRKNERERIDKRWFGWMWEKIRYGFDSRDTWCMEESLSRVIYERLCMYNEVAGKFIDLEFHEFEIDGETWSEQKCINYILDVLKRRLQWDKTFWDKGYDELEAETQGAFRILSIVLPALWW
jgi:hypothetical protein